MKNEKIWWTMFIVAGTVSATGMTIHLVGGLSEVGAAALCGVAAAVGAVSLMIMLIINSVQLLKQLDK